MPLPNLLSTFDVINGRRADVQNADDVFWLKTGMQEVKSLNTSFGASGADAAGENL
jgi:hypothetical protein